MVQMATFHDIELTFFWSPRVSLDLYSLNINKSNTLYLVCFPLDLPDFLKDQLVRSQVTLLAFLCKNYFHQLVWPYSSSHSSVYLSLLLSNRFDLQMRVLYTFVSNLSNGFAESKFRNIKSLSSKNMKLTKSKSSFSTTAHLEIVPPYFLIRNWLISLMYSLLVKI